MRSKSELDPWQTLFLRNDSDTGQILKSRFQFFPLVSKHVEVNNRWSITWSYAGQCRLQRPRESEEEIIWRGKQLGEIEKESKKYWRELPPLRYAAEKFGFVGEDKDGQITS